jgi:hypothetical protein
MKNKITNYIIMTIIMINQNLFPNAPTAIYYPTYQDAPGYNTPTKNHKFDNVKPILFTPHEDTVTGDDSNKDQVGYFWNIKDPDKTLSYPGKARIGNSQYINVVAIDSKTLNTIGDSNSVTSTGTEDIYHPSAAEKKLFDDSFLVPIGTFMKPNDPTVYTLLGQYLSTDFPDPRVVGTTGPDGSIAIVSQ